MRKYALVFSLQFTTEVFRHVEKLVFVEEAGGDWCALGGPEDAGGLSDTEADVRVLNRGKNQFVIGVTAPIAVVDLAEEAAEAVEAVSEVAGDVDVPAVVATAAVKERHVGDFTDI
jgi:hypothetical protein